MLDVKTLKVLEFLNEHQDEALSIYQMGKCGMTVNFETMQWLTDKNMVFRYEDEDAFRYEYEDPEYTYQINAGGRVALEEQKHFTKTERRANIALGLSVFEFACCHCYSLKRLMTLMSSAMMDRAKAILYFRSRRA